MRVLITGGQGQLGRSLQKTLIAHEVVALPRDELDVTDRASIDRALASTKPHVVVNAAALTDTNRCEREPALARAINGEGAANVARACARHGARMVQISTNEVFGGEQREPYREDAPARPLNAYAVSKLDGEILAVSTCPDTIVVRTSWLYGEGYVNFVDKVLAAADAGRALSFVTDEVATPTATDDVARSLGALLDAQAAPGVYHLANEGQASRYDWALEILRLAGRTDVPVAAVTTDALRAGGYDGPVKPVYSVLANTRAAALGIGLSEWKSALAAYFARARAAAPNADG